MHVEFKKLFDRWEFYIIFTVGLLISLFNLIGIRSENQFCTIFDVPSAFQTAMIYGGRLSEFFSVIYLPFLAVLPYVDQYYSEKRWGVVPCELTRQSRKSYFSKKALAIWIVAAGSILVIYLFNQICCLISYPITQKRIFLSGSIYDQHLFYEIQHTPMPELYMNFPFLHNMIHAFYACFNGGSVALSGFALSLYMQKNKAVANLMPIGIFLLVNFLGIFLFGAEFAPAIAIIASPVYTITSLLPSMIILSVSYIASIIAIIMKINYFKDIL